MFNEFLKKISYFKQVFLFCLLLLQNPVCWGRRRRPSLTAPEAVNLSSRVKFAEIKPPAIITA
jgi:hypothetical protein